MSLETVDIVAEVKENSLIQITDELEREVEEVTEIDLQYGKKPKVLARGNSINLECRSQTEYYGPLYVGSDNERLHMIYDTSSQWTSIALMDTKNIDMPSMYNIVDSSSAKLVSKTGEDGRQDKLVNFGKNEFVGTVY